jgi:hypothetical protein
MSRDVVQLWSAPQCQSGAVPLGPLTTWTSARVSLAEGAPDALLLTGVLRAELEQAGASDGCALRVLSSTRGVLWWVVSQITESMDTSRADVRAAPLRSLLALRGLVRLGRTISFTPSANQRVTNLVSEYVLSTPVGGTPRADLAADGLDWIELRTVDEPLQPVTLAPFVAATRAAVLSAIETASGTTAVLVPKDPLGATGFWLDMLADPAATIPDGRLSETATLRSAERVRDVQRSATVAIPIDVSGQTLRYTQWTVTAIDGAGPAWLTLRDPLSTEPRWPIRVDDQLPGGYIRGALTNQAITATRASDGSVRVANPAGFTVGDAVTLTGSAAGAPLEEIAYPAKVSASGRIVGVQRAAPLAASRSWLPSGNVQSWTNTTTLAGWTLVDSCVIAQAPRTEVDAEGVFQADGALSSGTSTITIKGGTPGARLYGSEYLVFGRTGDGSGTPAGSFRIVEPYTAFNSAGKATVTIAGTLSALRADGSVIYGDWSLAGNPNLNPKRPPASSLPADGPQFVSLARLLSNGTTTWPVPVGTMQLRSAPVAISFQSDRTDLQVVRAACGMTLTNGSTIAYGNLDGSGNITDAASNIDSTGRRMPALLLIGDPTGTPTRLQAATTTRVNPGAVVHRVLSVAHTITADTTVALGIVPVNDSSPSGGRLWHGVRWAALWIGDATTPLIDSSASNVAWHNAWDALLSRSARWRLRGVDLAALLADGAPLTLGQRVRLSVPSLAEDGRWRIVRIDWSLDDIETVSLELGAVQPRITAVTVSV